jgi:hypothetical protein
MKQSTDESNNQKTVGKVNALSKLKGKENKKSEAAQAQPQPEQRRKSFAGQAVLSFCEFFKSLLTFDAEGRIILEKKMLKFLLLNTSDHFQELVKKSRYYIL